MTSSVCFGLIYMGLYIGITNVFLRQTIYGIDIFYLSVNEAKVYLTSFMCVYSEVRQTFQ